MDASNKLPLQSEIPSLQIQTGAENNLILGDGAERGGGASSDVDEAREEEQRRAASSQSELVNEHYTSKMETPTTTGAWNKIVRMATCTRAHAVISIRRACKWSHVRNIHLYIWCNCYIYIYIYPYPSMSLLMRSA